VVSYRVSSDAKKKGVRKVYRAKKMYIEGSKGEGEGGIFI
jgi:hypothetical protein